MSLKSWADAGWLRPHSSSAEEIENLLEIVNRDLRDAEEGKISTDWQFGIAYNAVLKLCTILLYRSGYRPARDSAHYRTLQSLPLILGTDRKDDVDYLDECRKRRNIVEYDYAGSTTSAQVTELLEFARALHKDVLEWLKSNH